jgi:uncharacterized RDD family membrane protein YckC
MFQPYVTPAYAGFWYRFLAYIIDALISACVFFPLGFILGIAIVASGEDPNSPSMILTRLGVNGASVLVTWLYYAFCESSSWQGTIGKKALGLRVTDMNGQRIGFGNATGRHFGKILSGIIFGVGFIMIAFTEKKQGLHDIMAGTLVLTGGAPQEYPMPPSPPDFGYRGGGTLGIG